jgi:DDE superfamily endonuclease/Helix-turn-helix of DDE superfamily endonuclease
LEETLEQQAQAIIKLKQDILESSQKIISLGVDVDVLKNENTKLKGKVSFYKKFEPETVELKAKIRNLENLYRQTVLKKAQNFAFDIEKWDGTLISSFTGFQSWSSIRFLIEAFQLQGLNYKYANVLCLSLKDQIVLFLMKLRLDLSNNVLSKLFNISTASVSRIFDTLLNASHEFYFEGQGPLTKIPTRDKTSTSLPKCFIRDMSNCRVVIDCTEFEMEAPKLMNQKKLTFSSYKSRYTMKSLIGCSPNGVPVFVSDLYGGSLSDKGIVSASGFLEQLESGDLVLADKGFELYDILPPGVALNIPCFLTKNQFTLNETIQNRAISRARIIIERLNARFKIFKILDCIKAGTRCKANRIVKVCVALTTLMPTLMDELNEIE